MLWFSGICCNTTHRLLLNDSQICSETWEDNYNNLPTYQCPVNFMLYKELRISISERGWYVLVDSNFFSIHLHTYWQFNWVIMFVITMCCPSNIWILHYNGVNTILLCNVKVLFVQEHLSEFLPWGKLMVCILMQEHSQGRLLNCRNILFFQFFKMKVFYLWGCWLNKCKKLTALYELSWVIFD